MPLTPRSIGRAALITHLRNANISRTYSVYLVFYFSAKCFALNASCFIASLVITEKNGSDIRVGNHSAKIKLFFAFIIWKIFFEVLGITTL